MNDMMQTYPNAYYNLQNQLMQQQIANRMNTGAYLPQVQVVRVNGRNGADAYQIGANSSALLLDESGLLVWLVTTDGAGYKTVSAYDITPHKDAPAPDFASLEARIAKLEESIHGNTSDTAAAGAN
jgi:hypothetical protein